MMMEQFTQSVAVLGKLDPVSQGAGTTQPITDIDVSKYHRIFVVLDVGVFGGSATVDLKVQEALTAGGVYQDLQAFPKAITQLVTVSVNNHIATIELRQDEQDTGYKFIRVNLVVGTAATLLSILLLGCEANHKPANLGNITSVAQQVV